MAEAEDLTSSILADVKAFFLNDPASSRERIATMNEGSLRSLRDQLHTQLITEIPSVAGRVIIKRMPGNVPKLADDCWAIGASIAQGSLLKDADNILKPPDRRLQASQPEAPTSEPLPPAVIANVEAILDNMARLEREMQQIRQSEANLKSVLSAQQVRIDNLEERAARCAARDDDPNGAPSLMPQPSTSVSRSSHMPRAAKGSADLARRSVNDVNASRTPVSAEEAASETARQADSRPAERSTHRNVHNVGEVEPPVREQSVRAPTTRLNAEPNQDLTRPEATLASDVARSLDISCLAKAIVSQMQQSTGPRHGTDCEDCASDVGEQTAAAHSESLQVNRGRQHTRGQPARSSPRRNVPAAGSAQQPRRAQWHGSQNWRQREQQHRSPWPRQKPMVRPNHGQQYEHQQPHQNPLYAQVAPQNAQHPGQPLTSQWLAQQQQQHLTRAPQQLQPRMAYQPQAQQMQLLPPQQSYHEQQCIAQPIQPCGCQQQHHQAERTQWSQDWRTCQPSLHQSSPWYQQMSHQLVPPQQFQHAPQLQHPTGQCQTQPPQSLQEWHAHQAPPYPPPSWAQVASIPASDQQLRRMPATPLPQPQQLTSGEPTWAGRNPAQAGLFRAESWPSLPSRL